MQEERVNVMGDFLAAMRKSKGYTQQEVADRLLISNKTVSSWERGASCPDISMLPAIAELYGVTCDEIIAGERKRDDEAGEAAESRRYRKNLEYMLARERGRFVTSAEVSAALLALALISEIFCTYVFYRGRAGYFAALVFIIAAVTVNAVSSSRTNLSLAGALAGALAGEDINEEGISGLCRELYVKNFIIKSAAAAEAALLIPFLFVEDYAPPLLRTFMYGLPFALLVVIFMTLALTYGKGHRSFYSENERSYHKYIFPRKACTLAASILVLLLTAFIITAAFVNQNAVTTTYGSYQTFQTTGEFVDFMEECALFDKFGYDTAEHDAGYDFAERYTVETECGETSSLTRTGNIEAYTFKSGSVEEEIDELLEYAELYGTEAVPEGDGTYTLTLEFEEWRYTNEETGEDETFYIRNCVFSGSCRIEITDEFFVEMISSPVVTSTFEVISTGRIYLFVCAAAIAVTAVASVFYFIMRRGAKKRYGI
ncbi:MAG: helix-turn-helix domain-containing protein [Clostridia bacterium]|nr:helix-turn-helix domain-containing protein [Clostridia bacterium]